MISFWIYRPRIEKEKDLHFLARYQGIPENSDIVFYINPVKMNSNLSIRKAALSDHEAIWEILEPIVRRGGTYVFSTERTKAEMMEYWMNTDKLTYVAEEKGLILGTFYLKANQPDLGDHICNAGFMVNYEAQGKGIGRKMGEFALEEARRMGFRAMQFNFVIKTNETAVKLWKALGFQVIGEIPCAYRHPQFGEVPALIMYQRL